MPLTPFQSKLAKLLAANRSEDSYLAGGAAMHIEPNTIRYSNDLDYFNDSEKRVASAFENDRKLLEENGYQPVIRHEISGYQLHPIDLAINKVLALGGRNEPRDFLDVIYVNENVLCLGALCWAASGKDPGFTPLTLLELLKRRGRFQQEDFARLNLVKPVNLVDLKTKWLKIMDDAEQFIQGRPANELGCLYYNKKEKKFFAPHGEDQSSYDCHYGRPGGVLPQVEQKS
jgi:hypothetical protein